jgi:hypothetical protein
MKKFTQTTLIALLLSGSVFSQTKNEPVKNPSGGTIVNQAADSRLILLSPADGKLFTGSEGSKPVVFRWTAIVPKPKEAVTYRLKVWQLMQGQNSTEAMRSNQPIITKDVINITQAAISNLYTGPCKPPYLCDFIWAVEVLNNENNQRYGISDSYSFKYTGGIGTVTGSGGATVDTKSMDKELENLKVGADNKGNAGNTGMSGGKSLNTNGDSARKYKTYQPGKPIYGNINQSGDVETEVYSFEYGPKAPKDLSTGHSSGKSIQTNSAQGDPVHGVDVKPAVKSQDKGSGKEKSTKSTTTTSYE